MAYLELVSEHTGFKARQLGSKTIHRIPTLRIDPCLTSSVSVLGSAYPRIISALQPTFSVVWRECWFFLVLWESHAITTLFITVSTLLEFGAQEPMSRKFLDDVLVFLSLLLSSEKWLLIFKKNFLMLEVNIRKLKQKEGKQKKGRKEGLEGETPSL